VPAGPATATAAAALQIYGAWRCGNDARIWGTARTTTEFDSRVVITHTVDITMLIFRPTLGFYLPADRACVNAQYLQRRR
jgi:hypothetical protein